MASPTKRLATNVPGDFYVDATCIDCETCRWVAPETFGRKGPRSCVERQPATPEEVRRAELALVACPTASIGVTEAHDLRAAAAGFPDPITGEVFHLGFHAKESFGAASYLVVRPGGNVMVDAPRFAEPLARRIEALGGVRTIVLTHKDDVADYAKFRARFRAEVVIHEEDAEGELAKAERIIVGDAGRPLADDLVLIPVPGHTRGSMCLLLRDEVLFTGDHLAWDPEAKRLIGFEDACWYSWREQQASMQRLRGLGFERVLPGHGHPCHLRRDVMAAELERCIRWMAA